MEKLILIMSICSFIANIFILIADANNSDFIFIVIFKAIGLFGTVLPIIYWLKLLNII